MIKTPYGEAKDLVKAHLGTGKHHAISRQQLKQITKFDDRTNREIIRDLRLSGMPIMSSSDHKGYWLAESKDELLSFINEYNSRATECKRVAELANEYLNKHEEELPEYA